MNKLFSLCILHIFVIQQTRSILNTTNIETICRYEDIGDVTYCNLCSYDASEFRAEHECISCLNDKWYGLIIILLCLCIVLMSMMVILFHSPMTYRTVSIWLWIQIAAMVFYRASAVFTPIHKQWGFLSTITIFSTSIWKSQCNHHNIWDQGTSFGILFIECVTLFFIFFCSTYIHHHFRHSPFSQYAQYSQYSPYSQYQYQCQYPYQYKLNQENAMKKYYKLLISALSVFERRWQYQGNDNANNNDEDDIIEDENGSFVYHVNPGQHPIHPPIMSQMRAPNTASKGPMNGSPTITPITSPHTHKESQSNHKLHRNKGSLNMNIKASAAAAAATKTKHLAASAAHARTLTPTSNLRTLHTNTESTQYSSSREQPALVLPVAVSDPQKHIQIKKKKKRKKKLVKKKQITRLRLGTDSAQSNMSNEQEVENDAAAEEGEHRRRKSISSMTEEHLPTINEISPVQDDISSASKLKQRISIKKFENNPDVASHLNRLESVVEDEINDPHSIINVHSRLSTTNSDHSLPISCSPVAHDSMHENINQHIHDIHILSHSSPTSYTEAGGKLKVNNHISAVSQSSTTISGFSNPIISPPSLKSPPSNHQQLTPTKITKMKIKRQKYMNNMVPVAVLKDEKAFEYPINSDPNEVLSEETYIYMVDVVNNATHSRSTSQVFHSKVNDYPPQVETLFSNADLTATATATATEQNSYFTFPSQKYAKHNPVKSQAAKPPPSVAVPDSHEVDQNQNQNQNQNKDGAADGGETQKEATQNFPFPGVDSESFEVYLRVHNAVLSHLKTVGYNGIEHDPNKNMMETKRRESAQKNAEHELSGSMSEIPAAAAPQSNQSPTHSHPSQNYLQNLSRPTHTLAIEEEVGRSADHALEEFTFEQNLKQKKEVPVKMAFNITFLLCSPLILTEAFGVFHCVDIENGTSVRSKSQYVCAHDFWHYFGAFIIIGWLLYVVMSIYKSMQFVKKIAANPDERWEQIYRNAFGDSFSFFWINNVKLNKWWYGFIPILLQLLIISSSVFFDDVSYGIMLISLLLWFEFVVMCCIRPYLTQSDRLCQFTLRTFVLFESSMMVIAVHDNDTSNTHNLEPLHVAICSVIFVTLIISHLAACSGLYPIHPNSTVCSNCCCCCCFFCLEPMHDDDSDDDENYDDEHDPQLLQIQQQRTYAAAATAAAAAAQPPHQLVTASSNPPELKAFSDVGSDRPLLNQSAEKLPNAAPFLQTFNSSKTALTTNDNKNKSDKNTQMLSPQMELRKQYSDRTITPFHDASTTGTAGKALQQPQQPQSRRFNYSTSKNDGFTLPQNQSGYYKHYQSQTHTQTDGDTQRSHSGAPSGLHVSDHPHLLDLKAHMNAATVSGSIDDQNMSSNIGGIRSVPSLSSMTNNAQSQPAARYYNKVKSDSLQYNASIVSINSIDSNMSKTNTHHQ